jgi:hypothetical protein
MTKNGQERQERKMPGKPWTTIKKINRSEVNNQINNSFEYWFLKIPGTNLPIRWVWRPCKRFLQPPIIKKYLDWVHCLHLWAPACEKPGYQRSVGQVFACYGAEYSQASCGILQAFSITTTESLDKTYLVNSGTEAIEGVKISSTRYRSKSIDFLPQCLSWKHHGSLV